MDSCIVLAHGSIRKETNEVMDKILSQLEEKFSDQKINLSVAYLQLAQPSLEQEVKRLYEQGSRKIILVPMFIFDGVHVTKDIPDACRELEAEFKDLILIQGDHIGADPLLAQIVKNRIEQVLSKS